MTTVKQIFDSLDAETKLEFWENNNKRLLNFDIVITFA